MNFKYILSCLLFLPVFAEKIFLGIIENKTDDGYYRYDAKVNAQDFLLTPLSVKSVLSFTEVSSDTIGLYAIKGVNPSIFIRQPDGVASGYCGNDTYDPHYIELWTGEPNELAENKQYIRYCIDPDAFDDRGYFGLRIEEDGTPKLLSLGHEDGGMTYLDKEFVIEDPSITIESMRKGTAQSKKEEKPTVVPEQKPVEVVDASSSKDEILPVEEQVVEESVSQETAVEEPMQPAQELEEPQEEALLAAPEQKLVEKKISIIESVEPVAAGASEADGPEKELQ